MPIRDHGYRTGMQLRLHVDVCRACNHAVRYHLWDVLPEGPVFACPLCRRQERLELERLIVLTKRDARRLGRRPIRFFVEKQLSVGFEHLDVPAAFRVRLFVPSCPGCYRPTLYWLLDVYDTGPVFGCPTCPSEHHLHLEEMIPFALEVRRQVGGPIPRRLLTAERLLAPADRPPTEDILRAFRAELRQQGWSPRDLAAGGRPTFR